MTSLLVRASLALFVIHFAAFQAAADEMTLTAGAGFRRPIAEIAAAYEKQSGHKVLQIYGHLGQALAQARESDSVSMVCGDRAVLEQAKDIKFERMVRLGFGKLVVAYRKGLSLVNPDDLVQPEFKRIGIPNQANAIYGKAGNQFLQRRKLEAAIGPKLVVVATVPQVTSYVVSGDVDAGFVNATDAIGALDNIGGFVEVGAELYDPVEVVCGVVANKPGKVADGFAQFLGTEQARKILLRYGL